MKTDALFRTIVLLSDPVDSQEGKGPVSRIQIMKTGEFTHGLYGKISITTQDLHQFVKNFDDKVRRIDIPIDLNHEGKEAAGWIRHLDVSADGKALWADVEWNKDGEELVHNKKYRYISPEFQKLYKDAETGKEFRNVLLAATLTNRPFLKGMEPVSLSEDDSYSVHVELSDASNTPSDEERLHQAQRARARKFKVGIKATSNLTMPSEYRDDGLTDDDFADPTNYRYPITPEYVMAAYRYFAKQKNHDEYTPSERKVVAGRIVERLPEKDQGDARKEFDLSDQLDQEDDNLDPGEGVSTPEPTDDANAGQFSEPAQNPQGGGLMSDQNKTIALSEDQYNQLMARIAMAEGETKRMKFQDFLRPMLFNEATKAGKLTPAQAEKATALLMGMNDEQVTKFEEFLTELPDAVSFGEVGKNVRPESHPAASSEAETVSKIVALAEQKIKAGMDESQAFMFAEMEIRGN